MPHTCLYYALTSLHNEGSVSDDFFSTLFPYDLSYQDCAVCKCRDTFEAVCERATFIDPDELYLLAERIEKGLSPDVPSIGNRTLREYTAERIKSLNKRRRPRRVHTGASEVIPKERVSSRVSGLKRVFVPVDQLSGNPDVDRSFVVYVEMSRSLPDSYASLHGRIGDEGVLGRILQDREDVFEH